ncbi:MAG: hypothetical protein IJ193_08015 [Bacilli bacterium]|nr:hypothetical protein [Bacilli bacterium]
MIMIMIAIIGYVPPDIYMTNIIGYKAWFSYPHLNYNVRSGINASCPGYSLSNDTIHEYIATNMYLYGT